MKINHNVTVIGCGKLGFTTAVLFSDAFKEVHVIDTNEKVLQKIINGICPIDETGVEPLFAKNRKKIFASKDLGHLKDGSFVFVIVPTPSRADDKFDNKYVLQALDSLLPAIIANKKINIVINSTVMPRSFDEEFVPYIERLTGAKNGEDYNLFYNPYFIALGSIIGDILMPSFVLIGAANDEKAQILESFYYKFYKQMWQRVPDFKSTNYINAEMSKLAINTYCTLKISYANLLGIMAEKIPNADAKVICNIIGSDKRIGSRYLSPGSSFGGPCFPRDTKAFAKVNNDNFIDITDKINNINHLVSAYLLLQILRRKPKNIAVLGLSYKPNTYIQDHSFGENIYSALKSEDLQVFGYDDKIDLEKLKTADTVVITTNWREYKDLNPENFANNATIFDCWRIFEGREEEFLTKGIKIIFSGKYNS